jgi:hypothetical protein
MRKALLSAAIIAAGALTSMAQSNVYSLNVVGYVNVTAYPGFNIFANQLKNSDTTNGLNNVLSTAGQDAQVLKYRPTTFDFVVDIFDVPSGGWIDYNTGDPSTTKVSPGEGFFYYNPNSTNQTLTLVGEVTQGASLTVDIKPNYNLVSSIVPQAVALVSSNGFSVSQDMQYMEYNGATQSFKTPMIYDVGSAGWLDYNTGDPVTPIPVVGAGFYIYNADSVNHDWVRTFNVQ